MHILLVIALLDTAGFGIIIPIFLYYALHLGATPEMATMFFSIYPIAFMLSSPILGRLSDQLGRKPVMLCCLFMASVGYLVLGVTESLLWLAMSRFIQGAAAGNLAVVQAYVSDITDNESRAKSMGKIGAATGLGFVIGPAFGAWLGGGSFENNSLELAAFVSAGLSFMAFLVMLFFLPESLSAEQRATFKKAAVSVKKFSINPFAAVPKAMRTPVLREYLLCALLFNIASAFAEVILPLWLKDGKLIDGPRGLMVIFLTAGLVLTFVQARLIGVMVRRVGELRMFQLGIAGFALALLLLTVAGNLQSFPMVVLVWCLSGASMAFFFTGNQSLISQCAADHERGTVLGAASAVGTLGRIVGPSLTGFLYANVSMNAPFYAGAVLLIGGFFIASRAQRASASLSER